MKKDKTSSIPTKKPTGTAEQFERGFRKMSNKEARIFARAPCSEDTHFSANSELFQGTIKNVSQGGIYVQTRQRFVVGQEVVVAGPFGDDRQDVKRYGKVVWFDDGGIAVKFSNRAAPTPRR